MVQCARKHQEVKYNARLADATYKQLRESTSVVLWTVHMHVQYSRQAIYASEPTKQENTNTVQYAPQ